MKQAFLSNADTSTNVTQFAYGKLKPGEGYGKHINPTMDEYFFFLKGKGECWINGDNMDLKPNNFLRIPSIMEHFLIKNGNENIKFVYFGVSINDT